MLVDKLKQLNINAPVAIIGAGVTGKSCFDLLGLANLACQVFDEGKTVSKHFAGLEDKVTLGTFSRESFKAFGTILLSPGIDTRRPCFTGAEDKLLTDIELFARLTDKDVIGVTASNGKSTVVTLLHQVTQAAGKDYVLCGNIGLPVLRALLDNDAHCDGYIIELSSYHLERAPSLKPQIGVWLNVSPDHLDRYDSYADYVKTKAKLFAQSRLIVANADDQQVASHSSNYPNRLLFSQKRDDSDYYFADHHIYYQGTAIFDLRDFGQPGTHHADNLMAVFAVATALGIDCHITAAACKAFTPLPSRAVVVAKHAGITFINDSKGTNIGATVAAIKGLDQPIVLIAGGQGKDQDFTELAVEAQGRVKAAVLFGQDAALIEAALSKTLDCRQTDNLEQALELAIESAQVGDIVLLSPACASFDMFESYLKRGQHFETLVKD